MSVQSNRLSVADVPSFIDEDFLSKTAEILDRLQSQSELGGHPLLASILAIAKQEAEDDLRTRLGEFRKGGLLPEVESSIVRMAQRFAYAQKATTDFEPSNGLGRLLSFAARARGMDGSTSSEG